MPAEITLNRDFRGRVTGLAYFGSQLVVAADDESALDAFAIEIRKHRGLRSFVGSADAVTGLWSRVRSWHPAPALARAAQPLYLLAPPALQTAGADVDVRRAREGDAELVTEHSAAMILGELGYDPRAQRAAYGAAIRHAIAQGTWWVWIVDGSLRFQCNVGPRTAATAQLQGVWTPPEQRGNGWASLALGAIARRLFATETTLSLYVNDFNIPAIRLYEKLGFARIGTFATYLFP
ncbi:MAG TPA: GNAT family N-acetyltransferase [Candidatus Elarobacter sp.]